ncbi:MAG TPA: SIR2 family protein [Bryobacteraceae bacterium]|nr:SIR2 family protein [Bryobacteraceae bacterium]
MDKDSFVREFGTELSNGSGALFIGAGISKPSGVPTWTELIQPLASSRLGLIDLHDADLTQIAQYIVNESGGNRGALIHQLRSQLSGPFLTNSYHRALVQTQVATVWTTNYDVLLEQAFRQASFLVDVKATDDAISRSVPNHEVEIIKMHGSVEQSPHQDLVITAEDYEDFDVHRPATSERLRSDLLTKSFLFLGYSYRDPNIHGMVATARRLANKATRQHFLIVAKEQALDDETLDGFQRRELLAQLWSEDLRRFGIHTVILSDHLELEPLLVELAEKSRGNTVYVVGSHVDQGNKLAQELGRQLADREIILVDGQSEGIGREVITSFVEASVHKKRDVYKHLKTFPNPYSANPALASDRDQIPILKSWRAPLMRSTQICICFDGRMGTKAELELAMQSGCRIIPVPGQLDGSEVDSLLRNDSILRRLPEFYAGKIQSGKVVASDIIACIDELIG